MGITTYTTLKSHVQAHLDDTTTFANYVDEFVDVVESYLNDNLRVREMLTRDTASCSTSSRYLAYPAGYLEMKRLRLLTSPIRTLTMVTPENITNYDLTGTSDPEFYSDIDEQLEFNVIPSQAYTVEMLFYETISGLVANETNAILTRYPNIYLYGTLAEAFRFSFDEQRADYYDGIFNRLIMSANEAEKKRNSKAKKLSQQTDMPGVGRGRSRSILNT